MRMIDSDSMTEAETVESIMGRGEYVRIFKIETAGEFTVLTWSNRPEIKLIIVQCSSACPPAGGVLAAAQSHGQ